MPPPDLGELVIRTIKRALEPVTTRLGTAEARVDALESLRERLAAAEARLQIADQTGRDQAAALEAAGTRLATLEARPLEPLGPVRELLAAVEVRHAQLLDLVGGLRHARTDQATALEQTGARVTALEARQAPEPLGPTREALVVLEARVAALGPAVEALGAVRERLATLEARPQLPGPPGPAGADGLGFDDLAVDFDGAHTLTIRFTAGDRVKAFPITLPFLRYRGIYHEGATYDPGDAVTWQGSLWRCDKATKSRPGLVTTAAEWVLAVKGGRDGRDGKAGERGPAGPAGKDWQQVYDALREVR